MAVAYVPLSFFHQYAFMSGRVLRKIASPRFAQRLSDGGHISEHSLHFTLVVL